MKTFSLKKAHPAQWLIVDATGVTLGRLATQLAQILSGKNKPHYTPHMLSGDIVVVINAEKIHVSGNKLTDKIYYRHSGYPGGIKSMSLAEKLERDPEGVVRHAVRGMLPKNKLAAEMLKHLKVYAGPEHPHTAQKPEEINLRTK